MRKIYTRTLEGGGCGVQTMNSLSATSLSGSARGCGGGSLTELGQIL
jgi:hypothetical protein